MTPEHAGLLRSIGSYGTFKNMVSFWEYRRKISPEIAEERIAAHTVLVEKFLAEIHNDTQDMMLLVAIEKYAKQMALAGHWDGQVDEKGEDAMKRRNFHRVTAENMFAEIETLVNKQ